MTAPWPLTATDLAWARRLIGPALRRHPHLADDLTGAAFLALHGAAIAYRPGNVEFRPYAQRRVRGAVQDYLRDEAPSTRGKGGLNPVRMRPVVLADWEWEQIASRGVDPIERIEARERLAALRARVDRLPLTERDLAIVRQRLFEYSEMREIGRAHGITESRVCQIVLGALEELMGERVRPRKTSP